MAADGLLDPARHYDRVLEAWRLLLGEELHYGLFVTGHEPLERATGALTDLMIESLGLEAAQEVLDVGCGTGAQACRLAADLGVRVTGITTSVAGVRASRSRAEAQRAHPRPRFENRDGTDNRFPDASFDRVWALESSHLMRRRDRFVQECARVLRAGGRLALCDIVLRREMGLAEVRQRREQLVLLRDVFGDARMEPLARYAQMARGAGVRVDGELDLSAATRPTFTRWRENLTRHRREIVDLLGPDYPRQFADACGVMESLWDEEILGYGLLTAQRPA
jgi:27-O-demethylrifamycin SV methyltransferase